MNYPADPSLTDPALSPLPAPYPPYVTTRGSGAMVGKCHVHVNEFEDCESDKHNLATEVIIWDVGGNQIGGSTYPDS